MNVRAATVDDAESICRIYNQGIEDGTSTFLSELSAPDEIRGWFSSGAPILAVEQQSQVVAFAASSPWRQREWFRGIVEVAVYVARDHRGKGAGRAAVEALTAAAEQSGLRKLLAGVIRDNHASRALFERSGFRQIGFYERQARLGGVWKDVLLLEKLIPARVIFACVHNAGRSQMAAAFFNALAEPRLARAISAGTQPVEHVHPEVVTVMQEAGMDLSAARPQKLTADLARGGALLITMGCGDECPVVPGLRRDDWPLPDPKGKSLEEVRETRDEIRRRVVALLAAEGF
jgi:arsenate reductase